MKPTYPANQPTMPIAVTNRFNCLFVLTRFILAAPLKRFNSLPKPVFCGKICQHAMVVLLLSMFAIITNAQITSTTLGGNWNAAGTWVGGIVPGSSTAVTIASGSTVIVNVGNATCASITIGGGARSTAILSFTGVGVLTVSGNVVIGANLQRRGSINMSSGGIFKIGGTFSIVNLNSFTRGAGTIEYNGSSAQAVAPLGTYNNLVFSGSGAKSIAAPTTIAGRLSIAGAIANIAAGANIRVGSLALGGFNKANGSWGSTLSAATNKNNTYFAPTTGIITVTTDSRPIPAFSGLTTPPAITYGTPAISLSGRLSAAGSTYPADGETVSVTINGVTQSAVIAGGTGAFSINFPTATLNASTRAYTISYAYTGSFNLAPAVRNTSTTIRVNTASLTITANNVRKIYGTTITGAVGSQAFTAAGLQNGQTIGSVRIAYSTGAASSSIVGTYTNSVTVSSATGGTFITGNYRIVYVRAPIIVTPAPLIITANNQTKAYGVAVIFSGTAFTATGLVNRNTVTSVTLTSTGAAALAPVAGSPYAIVPSAAIGTGLSNYLITYNSGILTVTGLNQSSADFRSKINGNFSSPATWEFDQGGNSWTNATQIPGLTNNVSIGHNIILDQNYTAPANKILLIITGGTLTINPTITLDVVTAGTLNFNARPVIIKSTAAGTGAIGKILGTLTGASNVTVERFLETNKRAWRLLTIPVTGTTIRQAWAGVAGNAAAPTGEVGGSGTLITGHNYTVGSTAATAGFDWFTGLGNTTTSSIRFYTPPGAWSSAANTPNPLAQPAKEGYLLYVRGDRTIANSSGFSNTTLKPSGSLKQGLQAIPVNDAYTVVGNPYACAINLDDVYANTGNGAVIKRNFWVWDATLGTSGGYRTLSWNGVDEYDMTGGGGIAADYLPVNSGQAFIVERLAGGNLQILESNKTTAATTKMLRPAGTAAAGVSSLNIRLFQATGNKLGSQTDRVLARYNDIYQESPQEIYDAAKLNNFNENLSLVRNNNYLSIESRPFPTQNDTLYLPFWGLSKRDYALSFASNKFTGINQVARLIDAFTQTTIIINLNDSSITYPFSVTNDAASSSLNRFKIVMAPAVVLPVTFTKINVVIAGTKNQLSWATGSEQNVKNYAVERSDDGQHFNQIGQVVAVNAATGASYRWMDNQPLPATNFYRIRSNDADGKYAYSAIASVQMAGKKGIQVMPTIISNHQFNLVLTGQPAGNYQLKITSSAGQQVYQKIINNIGGINAQVIELGNTPMPTGVYNLSVIGLNGSNQNFRLLIQN